MEKILIHSYKGGTGKTTVSLNLASILSAENKVLLVENDFMMPSFFTIFKHEPKYYFNDYYNEEVEFQDVIVPNVRSNLDVIFTSKTFNPDAKIMTSDQSWFISMLRRLMKDLEDLENTYDYIVYDTPPGWHMIVINLIMLSTKAILILRPNNYAVNGTKRMIEILYKRAKALKTWDIYLLFNQIPRIDMIDDLNGWIKEFQEAGIKYAGYIPCSCITSYEMAHETNIFPDNHEFTNSLKLALKNIF